MAQQDMMTYTKKMPCPSIGISAELCQTGSKLRKQKGTPCHKCYAMRGNYLYPSVKNKHARVLEFMQSPDFVTRMTGMIMSTGNPHFRWFDSGDTQSIKMCLDIIAVCEATPFVSHWIPSKEWAMWSKAIGLYGKPLPDNVCLRLSMPKDDQAPAGKHPNTSSTFTDYNTPAFTGDASECPAESHKELYGSYTCGPCRMCWDKSIRNISYPKRYDGAKPRRTVNINSVNTGE